MVKQYKRKFKVPGDTIKDCWSFRNKCFKKFCRGNRPCLVGNGNRRDETRCPFPINKPTDYIVSETIDGEWQCSCPVWKFHRQKCHHIRKARADPEKYEIAKEFTEKTAKALARVFDGLGKDA